MLNKNKQYCDKCKCSNILKYIWCHCSCHQEPPEELSKCCGAEAFIFTTEPQEGILGQNVVNGTVESLCSKCRKPFESRIEPPEEEKCEHDFQPIVMNHPSGFGKGDKMCPKCFLAIKNDLPPSKCEEWEEEFEKEFEIVVSGSKKEYQEGLRLLLDSVKSFIKSLLAKQQEEIIKKAKGMKVYVKGLDTKEFYIKRDDIIKILRE